MTEGADAMIGRVLRSPVFRVRLVMRFLLIVEKTRSRFLGYIVLIKEAQEEINQLLIGLFAVLLDKNGRIGVAAETAVFGGDQRQGEILPEQQRLGVEPRGSSIPTLDRGRMKEVLAQGLKGSGQGNGPDP